MTKKRIFSGIKPSGDLHIGTYIGAIKQWVELQDDYDCVYAIVDLHAITVPQEPEVLKKRIYRQLALYLAFGVDPEKSIIFIQSHNKDHAQLTWILDCVASMGQLGRMTQYKSIAKKQKGGTSVGLFNYPVLMAADILLYDTDVVPVGDDQVQHVELTRELARRFNSHYQEVFKIPEVKLMTAGSRIMSLQDPQSKMSKSDESDKGLVYLLDEPEVVKEKIMSAVTDTGDEIRAHPSKQGITNLLTIYSVLAEKPIKELEKEYQGKGYGEFKKDLAKVSIDFLKPIQKKYKKFSQDEKYLNQVLSDGLKQAQQISNKKLAQVHQAMGLG